MGAEGIHPRRRRTITMQVGSLGVGGGGSEQENDPARRTQIFTCAA